MTHFLRTVALAVGAVLASLTMPAAPAAIADSGVTVAAGDPAPTVPAGEPAIAAGEPWAAPVASGEPATVVFPGMEIRQESTLCTLGFVDPILRVGFSAGHCRRGATVTDRNGHVVGVVSGSRDNTPDGSVVRTDEMISDYEAIDLAPDVVIRDVLPGGRQLVSGPIAPLAAGQPICHFGVVTGETCGTIERMNNGWFTMDNGVVSQKGDSGGPVYVMADNGKAVIVGLFNSTWGRLPAAVSWQATGQQLREDAGLGGGAVKPVVNAAASVGN